jgi:hypothetical protein
LNEREIERFSTLCVWTEESKSPVEKEKLRFACQCSNSISKSSSRDTFRFHENSVLQ